MNIFDEIYRPTLTDLYQQLKRLFDNKSPYDDCDKLDKPVHNSSPVFTCSNCNNMCVTDCRNICSTNNSHDVDATF
jgi:hypothetical protein